MAKELDGGAAGAVAPGACEEAVAATRVWLQVGMALEWGFDVCVGVRAGNSASESTVGC